MMMKSALEVVALFAVFSGVAFAGDSVVGLLVDRPEAGPAAAADDWGTVAVRPEIPGAARFAEMAGCDVTLDRDLSLSAAGLSGVAIHAGSGELRVEGEDGRSEIAIVGRVCASHEDLVDDLTVTARTVDGRAVIETHYPEQGSWSGSRTARIDLLVLVPTGMTADIEDSSGDMEVRRTGTLRIDDSSGGISVSDIRGSVDIDDSSGGVEVDGVRGDVRIDDGSGGLDVRAVSGSVWLRDGSGSIDVGEVEANVVVERDGSGSIEVRDVGGDFSVARDGSGSIRHSGVRGTVDVPADKRRGG